MKISLSKAMIDVQWAFISIITASLAHFIVRIFLGKELGAEGLGIYTLAFTVYLFGLQFAAFGIGSAMTKYVAEFIENKETIKNYVSSGITSSLVTGILMGIVLFFLAPFIAISIFKTPELIILIQLTAVCFPFIAIQKAVLGTLNGLRKMHVFAFLNIFQNVSIVAISLVLVLIFNLGVLGAVIGFIGPTILVSVTSPVLILEYIKKEKLFSYFLTLRETTIFGFYVVLGNSISFLNNQVSNIFIGYYLNPTEVGIYAVAALLAQSLTLIPSAVQQVTTPVTATLYGKKDIERIRKIVLSTMKKILFISIGIAILIAIFGQFIILILFSKEFFPAYVPLLILLLGNTIFAPFMAVGATLSSIGKVHIPFRINFICGILNVILNIIFISYYGIIGAAVATTVSLIFSFGINTAILHMYLKEDA